MISDIGAGEYCNSADGPDAANNLMIALPIGGSY